MFNPLGPQTLPYDYRRSESNRLEPTVDLQTRLKTGTKILKGIQGLLSGFQAKTAASYPDPELRQESWDRLFRNIFSQLNRLQEKITPEVKEKENILPALKKLSEDSVNLSEFAEVTLSKIMDTYSTQPSSPIATLPEDSISNVQKNFLEICKNEVVRKAVASILKLKEKIDLFGKTLDCDSPEVKKFMAYVSGYIPDFMVKQAVEIRTAKNEEMYNKYTELKNLWVNINHHINEIGFNLERLSISSTVLPNLRTHSLLLEEIVKAIEKMHAIMSFIDTDNFSKHLATDKKSEIKRNLFPDFDTLKKAVIDLEGLEKQNIGTALQILKTYRNTNHLIITTQIAEINLRINELKTFKTSDIRDSAVDMELEGQRREQMRKLVDLRNTILQDWNHFCFRLAKAEFEFDIFDLTINHVAAITDFYLKGHNIMQEMRFTRLKEASTRSEHLMAYQLHSGTYEKMRNSLLTNAITPYFKGIRSVNAYFSNKPDLVQQVEALKLPEEITKLKPSELKAVFAEDLTQFKFIWDCDDAEKELLAKFKELRTTSAELLGNIHTKITNAIKTTLPDVLTVAAGELNRVSRELERTNSSAMASYDNCFNKVYPRENALVGGTQSALTDGVIAVVSLWSSSHPIRVQHIHKETLPIYSLDK